MKPFENYMWTFFTHHTFPPYNPLPHLFHSNEFWFDVQQENFSGFHTENPKNAMVWILMRKLLCSVIMLLHWLQLFISTVLILSLLLGVKIQVFPLNTSLSPAHQARWQQQNLMRWTRVSLLQTLYISPADDEIHLLHFHSASTGCLLTFPYLVLCAAPSDELERQKREREREKWDH